MEIGNANKAICETKMNTSSRYNLIIYFNLKFNYIVKISRAHTIIELVIKQTFKNDNGSIMERRSVIDLIDLAGSEKSKKSGTSGERFKEGFNLLFSLFNQIFNTLI